MEFLHLIKKHSSTNSVKRCDRTLLEIIRDIKILLKVASDLNLIKGSP